MSSLWAQIRTQKLHSAPILSRLEICGFLSPFGVCPNYCSEVSHRPGLARKKRWGTLACPPSRGEPRSGSPGFGSFVASGVCGPVFVCRPCSTASGRAPRTALRAPSWVRTCNAPTCGAAGGASKLEGLGPWQQGTQCLSAEPQLFPAARLEPVGSIRFHAPAGSAERVAGHTAERG